MFQAAAAGKAPWIPYGFESGGISMFNRAQKRSQKLLGEDQLLTGITKEALKDRTRLLGTYRASLSRAP